MVYKWYILPIGGLYATYHLLREPETTIDYSQHSCLEGGPLPVINGGYKSTYIIGVISPPESILRTPFIRKMYLPGNGLFPGE